MGRQIKWRKPFTIAKEGEYTAAIVIWAKQEHLMQTHVLSEEERKKRGYGVETVCVQYRYYLQVDLWFVCFIFTWYGENTSKEPTV